MKCTFKHNLFKFILLLISIFLIQYIEFSNADTVREHENVPTNSRGDIKHIIFIVDGTVSMINFKSNVKQAIASILKPLHAIKMSLISFYDPGMLVIFAQTIS